MEFEYDARTKEYVEQRGTDIGITVMQCEQCGLYYKPMLGHVCPLDRFDERTKAFFVGKPSWYACGLAQCEKCGLMYKPSLGHVCPGAAKKEGC